MSNAIIARRRKTKINYTYNTVYNYIYNIVPPPNWDSATPTTASIQLLNNTVYEAPSNAANNTISVMAVGGSGSSNSNSDGQSGEVATADITVEPGELIYVNVGEEGTNGGNGGTTSFGTYLSAEGGLAADNISSESSSEDSQTGDGYVIIQYEIDDGGTSNE